MGQDLSKDVKWVSVGQRVVKSLAIKVGCLKKKIGANFFFRPLNLTGYSFAILWAMIMNKSSFESPKPFLLAIKLEIA